MAAIWRVELEDGAQPTVTLPPELAGGVGAVSGLVVEFGALQAEARLSGQGSARAGHLGLSGPLAEQLLLPADCPVQAVLGPDRRLRLGPVIGIVAGRTAADLTPARLRAVENHLLTYSHMAGLSVALAADSLQPDQRTLKGFRYLGPVPNCWEEGQFPLPLVLFRRFGVGLNAQLPFLHMQGVRVFNERVFHKWEFWHWASRDPALRAHLPETVWLKDPAAITQMLQRHDDVFVKPVWGSLGNGILRVRRRDSGYYLDLPGQEEQVLPDAAAVEKAVASHLPSPGIVQQGLNLAQSDSRLVDFRVVVQKDGTGQWSVTGIVGRCGTPALFLSNMATGGFPLSVDEALALLFGPSPTAIFRRKQELADLGVAMAEGLDRGGLLLADLGLDIAYDRTGYPWVIEANNRDPDHNIGWEYGNWPMFFDFRTRPAEYACRLAGFDSGGGGLRL